MAYDETPECKGAESDDDFGLNENAIFASNSGSSTEPPGLDDCFHPTEPDFSPRTPSGKPSKVPDDGFFAPVEFIGAVGGEADTWYRGPWTRWADH